MKKLVKTKLRKKALPAATQETVFKVEMVDITDLKVHPENYRSHGEDQVKHIVESIKTNSFYKNVVVAIDGTILAGHGAVEAAKQLGLEKIPAVRLNIKPDDKQALKILTGDNEISKLGTVDDRKLSEILKLISDESPIALLGTGFDQQQLANLIFVTRPAAEIIDFDAAAEWVGLPSYDIKDETKTDNPVIEITFKNKDDRDSFVKKTDLKINSKKGDRKWSTLWPFEDRKDPSSIKFKSEGE